MNGGAEETTLSAQQMPVHSHALLAAQTRGNEVDPVGNLLSETPGAVKPYIEDQASVPMSAAAIPAAGGSQPHTNFQPYLCVDFIISLFGIFPSPS